MLLCEVCFGLFVFRFSFVRAIFEIQPRRTDGLVATGCCAVC